MTGLEREREALSGGVAAGAAKSSAGREMCVGMCSRFREHRTTRARAWGRDFLERKKTNSKGFRQRENRAWSAGIASDRRCAND